MEIIDNFLEAKEFNSLLDLINGEFPWYSGDKVTTHIPSPVPGYEAIGTHKQLAHVFINPLARSVHLDKLDNLITQLGAKVIYRIKANLTFNLGKRVVSGWHYDDDSVEDMKVAVLYLNTNDGFTLLEDGTKVHSKANRLVTFDGNTLHTGVSQLDTEERLVLNINYR